MAKEQYTAAEKDRNKSDNHFFQNACLKAALHALATINVNTSIDELTDFTKDL